MEKWIIGYDLACAFAVFGMVVVNFKIVMGAEKSGPDWLVNLVGLLDGRAAATFAALPGAGLFPLSRKGRTRDDHDLLVQDRRTLLKRALFLFVIGLLYTPMWPADILHPVRGWPSNKLMQRAIFVRRSATRYTFTQSMEAK